jgi:hypothetical protein
MSGSAAKSTWKPWTVSGHYRDEELPDGGILDYDFAGVFYADTAEEAESLAYEWGGPWLNWDSMSVTPGAAPGVQTLIPESQDGILNNAEY